MYNIFITIFVIIFGGANLKKSNISLFFKLSAPFSCVFLISFILVSYTFNQKYDAQIDLSFVPKTIYTVEHVSKTSAIKISSTVSGIKQEYDDYKKQQALEEQKALEAQKILETEKRIKEKQALEEKLAQELKSKKMLELNNNAQANKYDFRIGQSFQYMSQHDPSWKDISFGNGDSIDIHGCGPTTLAMIVSNLTSETLTPDEAAFFAYERGLYIPGSGSSHSIFLDSLPKFGIKTSAFKNYSKDALTTELKKGNMFAVLMKNGVFSSSTGHFMLIIGVDERGNAIIADSNSVANSKKVWDLDLILNEAKYSAQSGGPFWLIKNPL